MNYEVPPEQNQRWWKFLVPTEIDVREVQADPLVDGDYVMELRSADGELLIASERVRFEKGKTESIGFTKPLTLAPGAYSIGFVKPKTWLGAELLARIIRPISIRFRIAKARA